MIPSESLSIQQVGMLDLYRVRQLADVIWPQTYRDILTEEQIHYMMVWMYSSDALERQLQDGHRFFILRHKDTDIGFASLSPWENTTMWKLHKIYLDPSLQGQGLGRYFLEALIHYVRAEGAELLELNVNRNNPALAFYRKMGFDIVREVDLPIGSGYFMNDFVMRRIL